MQDIHQNKKGKAGFLIAGGIAIIVGVIILVALIPILTNLSAERNLYCNDAVYPVLNSTSELCWNQTIEGNGSSDPATISEMPATDQSLIGLIATFLIIAFVIGAVAITGVLKGKSSQ